MPKGEHFKKQNPRNTQVSFKVNEEEWGKLSELAGTMSMSVPQWLRSQIERGGKPAQKSTGKKAQKQMTLF